MVILVLFILGVCLGSVLNALVFRLHNPQIRGSSRCLSCDTPLDVRDIVPVLSFFLLRGRCRHCKAPISWQYPLVELNLGLLFVFVYERYAAGFALPVSYTTSLMGMNMLRDLIFVTFLLFVFVYDYRHEYIPHRALYVGFGVVAVVNVFAGFPLVSMLEGAAAAGIFMLVQYVVSKRSWLGVGHIGLAVLLGLAFGLRDVTIILILAYLTGTIVCLTHLFSNRKDWKGTAPLGMFLSYAAGVVLFFGPLVQDWLATVL